MKGEAKNEESGISALVKTQTQANPSKLRQTQANSGKLKQTQANSSKLKQTQANPGKPRQTQTNPSKPRSFYDIYTEDMVFSIVFWYLYY